jgi:hypothetical protein
MNAEVTISFHEEGWHGWQPEGRGLEDLGNPELPPAEFEPYVLQGSVTFNTDPRYRACVLSSIERLSFVLRERFERGKFDE